MKKYFISGDIHGHYTLWMKALTENGFDISNDNHIIMVLGDLIDRGLENLECLKFVNSLPNNRKILIRGNHEDLMEEAICRQYFKQQDIYNYTYKTVEQVTGVSLDNETEALSAMKNNEEWNKYIHGCIDYYELGNNIFVHGWIPSNFEYCEEETDFIPIYYKDWRDSSEVCWNDARWFNGMSFWNKGVREPNCTIWCGHWHTSWGHSNLHNDGKEFLEKIETYYIDPETGRTEPHENFTPFIDDGIVAMDSCVTHSKFINVKVIEG